jgi:Ca2+-binding RTX toxin-like protein
MTLSAGVGSALTVSVGDDAVSTFKTKSIGAITASGDGRVNLSVFDTATADTATTSSYGAISAASMTSALSVFNVNATDVITKRLSITGGSGSDTIQGGSGADTITGGTGADSLVGGNGVDVFVYSVGDSNPVASGANGTSTGQDTVTVVEADDIIRVNVTSADNSWILSTHVLIGTAGASQDLSAAAAYTAATLLVQTGAVATGDNFDIAITKNTDWTNQATAQGLVAVNLTGTAVADTLTTGAQADTINGGAGADTITGGAGADSLTGGAGADRFVIGATDSLNTALDRITDFSALSTTVTTGTDKLQLATLPTTLVSGTAAGTAGADLVIAADYASSGATATTLATDLAAIVALAGTNAFDQAGDTIVVRITGTSVAGSNVYYVVQNQAADATYDAAADTVIALTGTSTVPTALADFIGA